MLPTILFLVASLSQLALCHHSPEHLSIDEFLNSDFQLFPNHYLNHDAEDHDQTVDRFRQFLEDESLLNAAYNNYQMKFGEKQNIEGMGVTKHERKEIFKDNLVYIFNHNIHARMRKSSSFEMGVNKFADMSLDEFKSERLGLSMPADHHVPDLPPNYNLTDTLIRSVPDSFDWRHEGFITPVKDQKSCGSCVMFAITSGAEALYAQANNKMHVDLSEQYMLDCATRENGYSKNRGCEGNTFPDTLQFAIDHGFTIGNHHPYLGKQDTCSLNAAPKIAYMAEYKRLPDSAEDVQKSIFVNGPVLYGVYVYRAFMFYKSGIYDLCIGNPIGGHAMAMVAFNNNDGKVKYYTIKNQWGEDWGENGFARHISTDPRCGMHKLAYSIKLK